jgi:LEA14-like dessication related protein
MVATALAIAVILSACAPGARMLSAPTFAVDQAGSGFVRIDPPGVGDGSALFRVALRVTNPNPFGLKLAALDGDLFFNDARAAALSFRGGLDVPANGTAPLLLDVRVPLGAAPALLQSIASLVGGSSVRYRLESAVSVDLLGTVQRFPHFTLATGELSNPLVLSAPRLTLVSGSLRFESVSSVALSLELSVTNPGIVGYRVSAPSLVLRVGGADAATASLGATDVPALGSATTSLTFRFDPLSLGTAVATQVQAASAGVGTVSFALVGGWSLDAPGLAGLSLEPSTLLQEALR